MTAAQLERLQAHLQRLRLFTSRERIEAVLQDATTKELSYADFLDQILTEEVTAKTTKNIAMRTSLARFPFVKSLDTFDFSYQPSVDRKQIQTLSLCHFLEHGENVILLGPTEPTTYCYLAIIRKTLSRCDSRAEFAGGECGV
jgi:DNA replication protein DnaC